MGAQEQVIEQAVGEVVTVPRLEIGAHRLRVLLDAAADTLSAYDGEIAPIRDRYAPAIRRHAAEIKGAREGLEKLLKTAPQGLFGKLKTRVLHAIKVGWRKTPDVWAWPDDEALVALIRERCTPEQADAYLVTTTVGRKDAIPAEVRKEVLGIACTEGKDAPVLTEIELSTGAALLALLAQLPKPAEDKAKPTLKVKKVSKRKAGVGI